jgi:hypothetical protein
VVPRHGAAEHETARLLGRAVGDLDRITVIAAVRLQRERGGVFGVAGIERRKDECGGKPR